MSAPRPAPVPRSPNGPDELFGALLAAGVSPEQAHRTVRSLERIVYQIVTEAMRGLEGRVDARFEQMEARFDARFEQIDARFEQMEARFDARFEQIDARFEQMDARFEMILHELRTDREANREAHEALRREIRTNRWAIGLIAATQVAVIIRAFLT